MTFDELKAIFLHVVKDNYFNFEGRASRYEFWWFVLINFVIGCICTGLDWLIFSGNPQIFSGLVGLALLLPGLGLCVRRLHDINRSGWWVLITLIPLVGEIIFIVWAATKGDEAANDFGEVPSDDYAQVA